MDITGIEHAAITPENREAFSTHMSKFDSFEAAALDGMDLKSQQGKPFKLPESLDKLPNDATRAEFTSKARGLLGIEHATDIAGLADVNLKKGLPEDSPFDENFATAFKQFAVEKKIPKSALEPLAEFFNLASIKAGGDHAAAVAAKFAADKNAATEALIAHEDFGTKEKLAEQDVLMHRALTSNLGLTTEEANNIAEFLRDREGATNPTLRRVLLKQLAPLAAESSNDGGGGKQPGNKPTLSEGEQKKEDEVKKILKWK
jgi:hypothetical protein